MLLAYICILLLSINTLAKPNDYIIKGKTITTKSFYSKILNKEILYSVYLPPGYGDSLKTYPILFGLHSFENDRFEYINGIKLYEMVDKFIISNIIPPMIIVTPTAGNTWYMNDYNGKTQYKDMFIEEFIPYIDENYYTVKNKNARALLGFSMGGSGALLLAMKNPELFCASVGYCSGISTKDQIISDPDEDYTKYHHDLYGSSLKGKERVNNPFINNNPLYLAEILPTEQLKKINWLIISADSDYHSKGNALLHVTFHERNIPHEFRVLNGEHNWEFVQSNLEVGVKFIGNIFSRLYHK
jgi:enterochelin esterase-like enzyme